MAELEARVLGVRHRRWVLVGTRWTRRHLPGAGGLGSRWGAGVRAETVSSKRFSWEGRKERAGAWWLAVPGDQQAGHSRRGGAGLSQIRFFLSSVPAPPANLSLGLAAQPPALRAVCSTPPPPSGAGTASSCGCTA